MKKDFLEVNIRALIETTPPNVTVWKPGRELDEKIFKERNLSASLGTRVPLGTLGGRTLC